jgi:hypothetical protein
MFGEKPRDVNWAYKHDKQTYQERAVGIVMAIISLYQVLSLLGRYLIAFDLKLNVQ